MIDQIDNYQRNAYGTTKWATDYAGRNPTLDQPHTHPGTPINQPRTTPL